MLAVLWIREIAIVEDGGAKTGGWQYLSSSVSTTVEKQNCFPEWKKSNWNDRTQKSTKSALNNVVLTSSNSRQQLGFFEGSNGQHMNDSFPEKEDSRLSICKLLTTSFKLEWLENCKQMFANFLQQIYLNNSLNQFIFISL